MDNSEPSELERLEILRAELILLDGHLRRSRWKAWALAAGVGLVLGFVAGVVWMSWRAPAAITLQVPLEELLPPESVEEPQRADPQRTSI